MTDEKKAKFKKLKKLFQKVLEEKMKVEKKRLVTPYTPPRYDKAYFEFVEWLNKQ